MEFQQILIRTIWKPKRQEQKMVIKGNILNSVILKDINKLVHLGKEIELTQQEVNKSKDLQNAIRRGWIEIVKGKDFLNKKNVELNNNQKNTSNEEILDLAKKMAFTMAEEMIKNSSFVKEIAKEVARETLLEIKQNLPVETSQISQNQQIKINDNPNNIFIDFNEENEVIANLENIGVEKQEKTDISNTLKKMEKLRKK